MSARRGSKSSTTTHATERCPACESAEAAIAFATRGVVWLVCARCDHSWRSCPAPGAPPDAWTSAAFRNSLKVMAATRRHSPR